MGWDLLAAVRPACGVGVDFSAAMIALARKGILSEFHIADAASFSLDEPFDHILLSDLVNDLADVAALVTFIDSPIRARGWS